MFKLTMRFELDLAALAELIRWVAWLYLLLGT